jgi:hypothetical protein
MLDIPTDERPPTLPKLGLWNMISGRVDFDVRIDLCSCNSEMSIVLEETLTHLYQSLAEDHVLRQVSTSYRRPQASETAAEPLREQDETPLVIETSLDAHLDPLAHRENNMTSMSITMVFMEPFLWKGWSGHMAATRF